MAGQSAGPGRVFKVVYKPGAMTDQQKLVLITALHSVIWVFYNVVIFYFVYAVIVNKIDFRAWLCLALVVLEGLVLLVFKQVCPVTIVARRYSGSTRHNFDIFLPNWLARYNKVIYTTIMVVATLVLIVRLLQR